MLMNRNLSAPVALSLASRLMLVAFCVGATTSGCGETAGEGSADAGTGAGTNDSVISGDLGENTDTTTAAGDASADTGASADTNAVDGGKLEDAGSDTGAGDVSKADTAGPVCPGGANCSCVEANDCDQGVCLDTADGKKCAQTCTQDCPGGFTCKQVGDGDPVFVCVANHVTICSPCLTHSDCNGINVGTLCLDYGALGKFCGGACKTDPDCPTDYACVDAPDKETGKISKQCKLKATVQGGSGATCAVDADCGTGESCADKKCAIVTAPMCPCSKWAKVFGKSTTCDATNEFGTCTGKRTCLDTGMSPCSAAIPAVETCNNIDDDCDGATDKLPASVTCTVATYLDGGSKSACTKDADCTIAGEGCDLVGGTSGECRTLIGACPGEPKCGAKGELLCANAKKATTEACNGLDDDCDTLVDEDFSWKEPDSDKPLAVGALCGQGACAGGKVACENLIKAICTTADKVTKESCDDKDNDCDGKVDDLACDDGNECTIDVCDGKSGTCANKAGADCNDTNPCTTDSCDVSTGKCVNTFAAGSCDDGDACTVGDLCVDTAEKTGCAPGGAAKDCDDNNPCTDDSCDKLTGCVVMANAVTQTCFGGDKKFIDVGTCKAGVRYCSKGVLGTTCEGEVLPNASEACDLKDDDCDGSIDEGCTAKSAEFFVSSTSGRMEGAKGAKTVYVHIDGDGTAGQSVGAKHTIWSGFVAWLVGVTGG